LAGLKGFEPLANGFLRHICLKRPMLYLAELQAQSFQDVNPFTSKGYLTVFRFAAFIEYIYD
jgi:hypothetical protein